MRVPDHYAALGIQETAGAADIRKAYKKRALQTELDEQRKRVATTESSLQEIEAQLKSKY